MASISEQRSSAGGSSDMSGAAARPVGHAWAPIAPLPDEWRLMCRLDLHDARPDATVIQGYSEPLMMLCAIETGIIERLYTVSREVAMAVARGGLAALDQFHAAGGITTEARLLIEDQRVALEMVMDVVDGRRELTGSYIRELHHGLTAHQETRDAVDAFGRRFTTPLLKGAWKLMPNSPVRADGETHEYCPPEFVQDEIDQMLRWYAEYQRMGVCVEVLAAWLHHRFGQIHPFEDGNGRVSRALTALVFVRSGYFVLVVRDAEHRTRYFDALESADSGDLAPLVDLFADIQVADINLAVAALR